VREVGTAALSANASAAAEIRPVRAARRDMTDVPPRGDR
jgi:hypothetical protein